MFFGLAWRRISHFTAPVAGRQGFGLGLIAVMVLLLIVLVPLRVIETGDPGWRPPVVLHGLLVTLASHFLLARDYGWKSSASLLPVTILAWSAVPYLWQVEQVLIRQLTGAVIGLTRECFILNGQPVELRGEGLVLGDRVAEVTDGCSGIRSAQSLLMTALFFGELMWLTWPRRLLLLGAALLTALVTNTVRAYYLASLQFSAGPDAVHQAHDPAGHIAFVAAAAILYGIAWFLTNIRHDRAKVRRVVVVSQATATPEQTS
jgi:exosortase